MRKNIMLLFAVSVTTLSALLLLTPYSYADTSAPASVTVSSSCSMTSDNTIAHTANSIPAHETLNIGNTNITVTCNDSSGSAIYAVGFSNDTLGTTSLIDISTNNTIPTGTGTSSSNWSMKLSIPSGNTAPTIRTDVTYDFTDYEVVPSSYALAATFPSSTDGTNNSVFSVTYRAYVSGAQAPGTYTGKVKYTLVHPSDAAAPSAYTITYADASNEAAGLPTAQAGDVASTVDVTLSSTEPTREGYVFLGWCTVNNSADTSTCSGTTYDAGDTYTITNTGAAVTVTFYAVWERDVLYMQDMTLSDCLTTPVEVYDRRDDSMYYAAKLNDNKCWMLDNLALDLTDRAIVAGMNNNNTNASNNTLSYLRGENTRDSNTDPNGKYATAGLSYQSHSGQSSETIPYVNTLYKNGTFSSDTLSAEAKTWKFGIYYNLCAASAGSYCYNSSYNPYTNGIVDGVIEDICPKGWRLPTGGDSGDFGLLKTYYNTLASYRSALKLPLGSSTLTANFQNREDSPGISGSWWCSNEKPPYGGIYDLYLNNNDSPGVYVTYSRNSMYGISLRCVLNT